MSIVLLSLLCAFNLGFVYTHIKVLTNATYIKLNRIIVGLSLGAWVVNCSVQLADDIEILPASLVENMKILTAIIIIAMFWLALKQLRLTIIKWKSGRNSCR